MKMPCRRANVVENNALGENQAEELKRELTELDGQIETLRETRDIKRH